ncbi:hypothetical protein [Flavobacterium sp. 9AF]|uniref:hypothetical protein n=1 Tax=Flavobacterium sp. 9AF TaxID=2653142 RepID=UPI00135AC9D2|nr:hypothetical protein [Flavobacterium sp. 9AF]
MKFTIGTLLLLTLVIWSCKKEKQEETLAETTLETVSCNLTEKEFNSWFASGTATENGAVNNANSITFTHNDNCDFYKWSEQMFLWLTSSTNGETVLESPTFYTVSPKNASGKRSFIKHEKGVLLRAMANVEKTGRVDSEEAQATDDVLMDKNGNLIYYISFANDVYAQFLTMNYGKSNDSLKFPTTAADLKPINEFAKKNGVVLKDSTALAMEIKTSWVVADTLIDTSKYITIEAIIPTYKKTETVWVISGERKAKLAMVGMHIVGSAAGHPEMIWATFEHKDNAPNDSYQYVDDKGNVVTVPADGNGNWLLNTDVSSPANVSHMKFSHDSIIARANQTISPSNTVRTKPWGSSYETQPNPEDKTPAIANTKVIDINNSVTKYLPGSDIRKNYLFLGATWTSNGVAPNGYSYSPSLTEAGVAIGSSQLANSTMETYAQNGTAYSKYGSCFSCHSNNGLQPTDLSHVYGDLKPLIEIIKK